MPILRHTAIIRNGRFYLDGSEHYRSDVETAFPDGSYLVTTEPLPAGPTNRMHRYYRGVVLGGVIDALNDVGNFVLNSNKNRVIVHEQMKALLLPDAPDVINPSTGEVCGPNWSLANLPRPLYGKYISDIRELTLDLTGWEIPPPPVDWETLEEIEARKEKKQIRV